VDRADEKAVAQDQISALVSLVAAPEERPEARLDALLRAAREWTGAEYSLFTVFGSDGPQVHGRSGAIPAGGSLPDISAELSVRSGAAVRHDTAVGSIIAVPVYAGSDVAGMLEIRSTSPAVLEERAISSLQILAGMIAHTLASELSGGAAGTLPGGPHVHTLHDPLTGLPGRALLYDRLHQAIQLARREEAPLAVMLLTLTHFEDLAARMGPESAQSILQEFANRTRAALRASDTVARADAERLAILLPGANAIGALGTAKKVLRTVGVPFALSGQHVSLQANAGLAMFPEHGEDVETLLARAGEALHQARDESIPAQTYGE
jgi:diguanylate cyclase (GGDEF)-like protein